MWSVCFFVRSFVRRHQLSLISYNYGQNAIILFNRQSQRVDTNCTHGIDIILSNCNDKELVNFKFLLFLFTYWRFFFVLFILVCLCVPFLENKCTIEWRDDYAMIETEKKYDTLNSSSNISIQLYKWTKKGELISCWFDWNCMHGKWCGKMRNSISRFLTLNHIIWPRK